MAQNRWHFPHVHRDRFASYPGERTRNTFWKAVRAFARLMFSSRAYDVQELKSWVEEHSPLPPPPFLTRETHVTWIGHSTFLITIGGKTILTDPIFGNLCYFLRFARLTPPGISIDRLPPIDAVLISHNHPDHMDAYSLHVLKERFNPVFLVPHGDKRWFTHRGFDRVHECMWWDRIALSDTLSCTFLPSIHWSRRGFFDHNRSLWGGWMIEGHTYGTSTVYFAGDTAYGSHFKAIAERYPSIDAALLPIGPGEPRELMYCSHVNAEEAGQAFLDLGARALIPMHWGAYHLGTDKPLDPIRRLQAWWKAYMPHLEDKSLSCLKIGQTLNFIPRTLIAPYPQLESTLQL